LLARIRRGQGYWRAMHCVDASRHPYDEPTVNNFPPQHDNSSSSTDKAVALVEKAVSTRNECHKIREVNSV